MLQALTSPVSRAIAIAGLLLALTVALHGRAATPHREARLVLHTVWQEDYVYLSWWHDGDVRVELEPGELPPMVFTARAWIDGCHWKGIETLEPIDAHHYAYRYDEVLLHCRPGGVPWIKTPRVGIVTVIE